MHPRGICPKYPPELGCEAVQPILATATYPAQDAQMPKAELNISLAALLQLSKAHWAILNDTDFPKAGGVFFSTTKTLCHACISMQKEQFIHDGESWL